jgi:hypothetical protein
LFDRAIKSIVADQIILSTVKGDPCIKWAEKHNVDMVINDSPGIFNQIINALPRIKHPYTYYASSNDKMLPFKAQMEIDVMGKNQVCYSSYKIVKNGETHTQSFHPYSYKRHLQINFVNDCAMVRTETLLKYGFNTKWGNSAYHDLWLRIYKGEGNVFAYNPMPTWIYYVGNNSQHVLHNKDIKKKQKRLFDKKQMLLSHDASL